MWHSIIMTLAFFGFVFLFIVAGFAALLGIRDDNHFARTGTHFSNRNYFKLSSLSFLLAAILFCILLNGFK